MDKQNIDLETATLVGNENLTASFGELTLIDNYPSDDSSARLFDEMDLQRATQAYFWSLPLAGFMRWREQQEQVFGATHFGDFVVYDTLKEKRGIITANLTTPYVIGFANLSDGPVSIDYPAGATAGGVLDFWQRPIIDMGLTGPDKGKGGGFLIIGPDESLEDFKDSDRFVAQSATRNIFIAYRILSTDPAEVKAAKEGLKLGRAGSETKNVTYVEGLDKEWDGTPARGLAYWESLASLLQEEPVREVDKLMMSYLEPLGITATAAFAPDERQQKILSQAATLGELMARNIQVNPRYTSPYWPGTEWYKSFDFGTSQETTDMVQLDERTTWFYEAVTSTKGMVEPTPGAGQVYMTAKRDFSGELLRADRLYKLHVPADVPVAQFWSLTLYSEETRRPYDNGIEEIRAVSLDSRDPKLKFNKDGSIDLFIGPNAPEGYEDNWMKTLPPDGWFVYFRLYAPTEPFFDKTWSLTDFAEVK